MSSLNECQYQLASHERDEVGFSRWVFVQETADLSLSLNVGGRRQAKKRQLPIRAIMLIVSLQETHWRYRSMANKQGSVIVGNINHGQCDIVIVTRQEGGS
jgi:hypothetical protein